MTSTLPTMKFEHFQLLSSALRLARFGHVWLVNKREPEWKSEYSSKTHAKAWIYDWNPCHEALKDQIKKDLVRMTHNCYSLLS